MMSNETYTYKFEDRSRLTQQLGSGRSPDEVLSQIFGDRFREYRRQWYAADKFQLVPNFPLELGFDLKFACNLRCKGCYFSDDTPESPYESFRGAFPLERFREIVSSGVTKGLASVYFGYASEPTMNNAYLQYVKEARRAGILDVWFGTNGTLLDKESIDRLIELKVSRLLISVDAATHETYEKIRVRGKWDRLVENIDYLVARKRALGSLLPIIRLSFVVTSINRHEVDAFVQAWQDKVDYFSIQKFCTIGESQDYLFAEGSKPVEYDPNFACPQPFQRMFINANGDVYPCCSFENMYSKELLLGNVMSTSVEDIWRSPKIEKIRDAHRTGSFSKFNACTNCAKSSGARAAAAGA